MTTTHYPDFRGRGPGTVYEFNFTGRVSADGERGPRSVSIFFPDETELPPRLVFGDTTTLIWEPERFGRWATIAERDAFVREFCRDA